MFSDSLGDLRETCQMVYEGNTTFLTILRFYMPGHCTDIYNNRQQQWGLRLLQSK